MSTMLPQGESLRRAVKWISEHLQADATAELQTLIHQAITKFDLSPRDSQLLINFYRDQGSERTEE